MDVVRCEQLITKAVHVVNEAGDTRAVLAATENGSMLTMLDDDNKVRVCVSIPENGVPLISVADAGIDTHAIISFDGKAGPCIVLKDWEGRERYLTAQGDVNREPDVGI